MRDQRQEQRRGPGSRSLGAHSVDNRSIWLDGLSRGGPSTVPSMKYRKLGSSDLEVSEISLGSWLTYSGGVEFDQTRACTDAAFEAGINFFDTANVYGRGAAETAWGEILSG